MILWLICLVISNRQYGYVKGRSTALQLLQILDKWINCLENGGQIDAVYTDFEKAFDKVPHNRLILKLSSYGISKTIIKWIQDFLTARKLRVRVNMCKAPVISSPSTNQHPVSYWRDAHLVKPATVSEH